MDRQELINEINEKYGEWIEMAADQNAVMVDILVYLLIKQRELNKYYNKVSKANV